MLEGEALPDLWRSQEVLEALDLCIACKSCKSDCPVGVDIATYKAEFMAHHYAGRLRPRAAYSMGLIHWWAHLAVIAPGLANAAGTLPGIAGLAKLVAGVDSRRQFPRFAGRTFRRQLPEGVADLGGLRGADRRVVLFAASCRPRVLPRCASCGPPVSPSRCHEPTCAAAGRSTTAASFARAADCSARSSTHSSRNWTRKCR
jgi:Fe-S oxidoreductase